MVHLYYKLITNVLCLSGIRLTQEIVDAPANEMHTDSFLEVQIFKCSFLLPIYGNTTVSSTTVSCCRKLKRLGKSWVFSLRSLRAQNCGRRGLEVCELSLEGVCIM